MISVVILGLAVVGIMLMVLYTFSRPEPERNEPSSSGEMMM
jgi:hypothetical protein